MENKILLQELAEGLARRKGMTKRDADTFVRTVFEIIGYYLQTEKMVKVKGLGTFKLVSVESRESVNVNTGERIQIKGHTKVSFTPDTSLRDQINKPFAEFETVILHENTSVEEMERIDDVPVTNEEDSLEEEIALEETIVVEEVSTVEDAPAIEEILVEEEIKTEEPLAETVVEDNPSVEETPTIESSEETIEETQEVVPEREDPTLVTPPTPEQKRSGKGKYFLLFILILMLMGGSYFVGHYQSSTSAETKVSASQPTAKQVKVKKTSPVKQSADSLQQKALKTDTLNPANEKLAISMPLADSAKYEQVPDGEFLIVGTQGTHTVANGQTIRIVAEKVYGKRSFASYIIVHNKIETPDAIEIGTVLNLPKLEPRTK